jgi:hypothetical protein
VAIPYSFIALWCWTISGAVFQGFGHIDRRASWLAAVVALQEVWPLPESEAGLDVSHAIAYASSYHPAWLWDDAD